VVQSRWKLFGNVVIVVIVIVIDRSLPRPRLVFLVDDDSIIVVAWLLFFSFSFFLQFLDELVSVLGFFF